MNVRTEVAVTESPFPGRIALPYTLTSGQAAGAFLAELANRRIIGSRVGGGRVMVPAQDFCAETGQPADQLVVVGSTGSITAFTETSAGVLAMIRLDGADTDMIHRVLDTDVGSLQVGMRVEAVWADDPKGEMLDLKGFRPNGQDPESGSDFVAHPLANPAEPIAELPYEIDLRYEHAYGPYYGRMFDEIATNRRILGVQCPSCGSVLLPPREFCDACFQRTGQWVDVADTGVLQAFSVIHLEFVGQVRKPPYIYAEIVLDGSATRLIHTIEGISPEEAREKLKPGMRVRAVWKEGTEPTGSLDDISHFEVIEQL